MKRLNIITLLLLSTGILSAQVPGYLGKKLSVGYKVDVSPVVINRFLFDDVSVRYDGTEAGLFTFGLFHNLDLEYVISRKVALRASYGYSKSGLTVNKEYDSDNREPGFIKEQYPKLSKQVDIETNDPHDYDYLNMDNSLIKLGMTFSRGNYIAPHGRTHSLYFLTHTSNCNYVLGTKSNLLTTVKSYGFMYERSSRRIIRDCVILEYGISFGYLFGGDMDANTAAKYITSYQNGQLLFQGTLGIRYLVPKFWKK